jgi:hypothetical protein
MKAFSFTLTLLLVVSCGNPHYKLDSEFVRNTPTIGGEAESTSIFFGAEEFGYPYQGESSSGFSNKLTNIERFDFSQLDEENVPIVIVQKDSLEIEILHKTESIQLPSSLTTSGDYYSAENFDLTIKSLFESGARSSDRKGVETGSVDAVSRDVFLFNFSRPISAFGGYFVDVESSSFVPSIIRLFDCDGRLIEQQSVLYPQLSNGEGKIHFIGFTTNQKICAMGLTVGDYEGGNGAYRGLGLDEIVFQD